MNQAIFVSFNGTVPTVTIFTTHVAIVSGVHDYVTKESESKEKIPLLNNLLGYLLPLGIVTGVMYPFTIPYYITTCLLNHTRAKPKSNN